MCSRPAKEEKKNEREGDIEWEFALEWMWKSKRDWMKDNVKETAIEWLKDRVDMNESDGVRVVKEEKRLSEWQSE